MIRQIYRKIFSKKQPNRIEDDDKKRKSKSKNKKPDKHEKSLRKHSSVSSRPKSRSSERSKSSKKRIKTKKSTGSLKVDLNKSKNELHSTENIIFNKELNKRRANSLPNHGKNHKSIPATKIESELKKENVNVLTSKDKKVSTWLTNYGMQQSKMATAPNGKLSVNIQNNDSGHYYYQNRISNKAGVYDDNIPQNNTAISYLGRDQLRHYLGPSSTNTSFLFPYNQQEKQQRQVITDNYGGLVHPTMRKTFDEQQYQQASFGGGGERVGWEYHNIILNRVPVYGFGIAVSGGRDNPHFMNGDPSIAISDVLKAGPAEGKLLVNDRVISANGISLENVDYSQAIHVLRECGNSVNLLIKRRALIPASNPENIPTSNSNINPNNNSNNSNNILKITLNKNSKKEDLGIILGCRIYIKDIIKSTANSDAKDNLKEGDIIYKINNTNVENLTLKETKKLLDNAKDKITLVVRRDLINHFPNNSNTNSNNNINHNFLNENGNYINGHSRTNSGLSLIFRPNKWSNNNVHNNESNGPTVGVCTSPQKDSNNIYNSTNNTNDLSNSQFGNNSAASMQASSSPNAYNSSLAVMANERRVNNNNGWCNQNLYVQPPTRNDLQTMSTNNLNSPVNKQNIDLNNSSSSGRNRDTTKDLSSFEQQQQSDHHSFEKIPNNLDFRESKSSLSSRPLPQKPTTISSSSLGVTDNDTIAATIATDLNNVPNCTTTINNSSDNNNNPILPPPPPSTTLKEDDHMDLETIRTPGEIRYIAFQKEGSVGIRLTGGNDVGIFVTAVQPGSPAYQQGLQVGDKILKANNVDMKDFTREEAVLYLLKIKDRIELFVQNCKEEYETIVAKQKGDSFYIRVHFNYDSEGKGELSFHNGDIFHVVDTLFNGVVGSWFVYRLGRNNQEIQKGSIPNKSRADELAAEQRSLENRNKKSGTDDLNLTETSSRRGNFFKRRRSARRSKSLCKEHWEDIVFGNGDSTSKFSAYERVTLKHPGFVRPIIFFGPLADIAREKLIRDYPEKFESPQSLMSNGQANTDNNSKSSKLNPSGIFRLSTIKDIIDRGKHALLDIAPSAVDRLNYAQYYPIVIFMRVENKSIVKELRSRSSTKNTVHRSSRKLFEQSIKLEKLWHHVFTSSITLTSGGDLWYKKLREVIDKQQVQNIWMSEYKPEESISDDFLFPMNSISRLSYASSPESDLDISVKTDNENDDKDDDDDDDFMKSKNSINNNNINNSTRLTKASSDPSLAAKNDDQTLESSNNNNNVDLSSFGSPNKLDPSKSDCIEMKVDRSQDCKSISKPALALTSMNKIPDNISDYPTLKIGERMQQQDLYDTTPSTNSMMNMVTNQSLDSPLPPPPPPPQSSSTLSSLGINSAKIIQPQYLETPPRIDRGSKPSRFRSAHERLFGQPAQIIKNNVSNNNNGPNCYGQIEDSDYINTTALEYSGGSVDNKQPPPPPPSSSTILNSPNNKLIGNHFGDTASYNSADSYNKYGPTVSRSATSTTSTINDPYRFTRSTAQPVVVPNPVKQQQASLERTKPNISQNNKMMDSVAVSSSPKKPPSPPPKPILNKLNQQSSLQYQMNSMSLNDRQSIPPRKPYLSNQSSAYEKQIQQQQQMFSDYDNMPPIHHPQQQQYPLKVPPKHANGATTSIKPMQMPQIEMSNGPPGYYQSLPQSSFSNYGGSGKDFQPTTIPQRYSSHAETISNFMNGTNPVSNNSNNLEIMNGNSGGNFSSIHNRERQNLPYNGNETIIGNKTPINNFDAIPGYNNKYNNHHSSNNYDNIRFAPETTSTGFYINSTSTFNNNNSSTMNYINQLNSDSTYLNLPFNSNSRHFHSNSISFIGDQQQQHPSPLPPPPPLPTYHPPRSNNVTPNIVQPTPQQPTRSLSSGQQQYLDLSLNRENRGSAFEVYQRKPISNNIEQHSTATISNSPMFQGLPPPPALPINDFNHVNYTNIDEIISSSSNSIRFARVNGIGNGCGEGYGGIGSIVDDNLGSIMKDINIDTNHVIATARGIFGSEGGSLVSAETGVSIIIPPNAIPDGVQQEIYFKVCEDKKLAPPLDRQKGETLLSPIVMCGPHGLRFNIPIELRLPHCAIVNPESWSFALKSSDTNNGEPAGWRNISLNNNENDGISGNDFNEQFVSVLVDHF